MFTDEQKFLINSFDRTFLTSSHVPKPTTSSMGREYSNDHDGGDLLLYNRVCGSHSPKRMPLHNESI